MRETRTIEVDTLEFSRLILEGKNIRYEDTMFCLAGSIYEWIK